MTGPTPKQVEIVLALAAIASGHVGMTCEHLPANTEAWNMELELRKPPKGAEPQRAIYFCCDACKADTLRRCR